MRNIIPTSRQSLTFWMWAFYALTAASLLTALGGAIIGDGHMALSAVLRASGSGLAALLFDEVRYLRQADSAKLARRLK